MFFKSEKQKLLEELRSLSERLAEDRIYEKVIAEVENDELDAVAKAKAFEEAEGDSQQARALYIKHRVRRIRDLAAEYEIWLQQESARKEIIRKEDQEQKKLEDERIRAERKAIREYGKTKFELSMERLGSNFRRKAKRPLGRKAKRPLGFYRGQPIYETTDGYRTLGAWFESVSQAKSYIDNNPSLHR